MSRLYRNLQQREAVRCLLLLALFFAGVTPAISAGEKKVWLLKQNTIVIGPYDVYINDSGLRAVSLKSNLVIVARAPTWKIFAFNNDAKTSWSGELSAFRPLERSQKFFTIAGGLPALGAIDLPIKKDGCELGIHGTVCSTTPAWSRQQRLLQQQGAITDQNPLSATYFLSSEICHARQPGSILTRVFAMPDAGGIPLRYSIVKLSHSPQQFLSTISAQKIAPPRGWLDVPTNYKSVKSMEEVNMDRNAQEGINQMLDNIREPK